MKKNSWGSDLFQSRFWAKVEKSSGCWTWTGGKLSSGYGRIRMNMKRVRAHRAAWRIAKGEIPTGMSVLHKCDNPACVNPDHLFLGTQQDNLKDMCAKGRGRSGSGPGELNGNSKVTWEQARILRCRWHTLPYGEKGRLAVSMNISHQQALRIATGECWREEPIHAA